jgi:hypothetical protein
MFYDKFHCLNCKICIIFLACSLSQNINSPMKRESNWGRGMELRSEPITILLEFCELFHVMLIMEPRHAAYWNFLYSFMWCKSFNPERWSLYYYFITCLLQEMQGYPESRRIVKYGVSLVYGKSRGWSSIKTQHHDHWKHIKHSKLQHKRSSIKIQHNNHQSLNHT